MKEKLVLLHGALGSASQMETIATCFNEFDIIIPDLPGHGTRSDENDFSIHAFAEDVIKKIKDLNDVHVFGYSMGGYVALYMAIHQPGLLRSVITLGTRLQWDPLVAENECRMLDPATVKEKVPAFAEELQKRHGNWEKVMKETAGLLRSIGNSNPVRNADYDNISIPVLLMLGDRDKMVTLDETIAAQQAIKGSSLSVLPGTPHPFEKTDPEMVAFMIKRFISGSR